MDRVAAIKNKLSKLLNAEPTDFQSILELTTELAKHDKENLRFVVDAGAITHLGKDSIKDHSTAVVELVKNSYDAGASIVVIDITTKGKAKSIRIADNGSGMSEADVLSKWLRIGYSDKRMNHKIQGRRKTGEKGIGRISADRLGSQLVLATKASDTLGFGLSINWDDFGQAGKDLVLIPFKRIAHPDLSFPSTGRRKSNTGTTLHITGLRNEWLLADFKRLHEELRLLRPMKSKADGFTIVLNTDADTPYQGTIEPPELPKPEMSISAHYKNDGNITYTISGLGGSNKPTRMPWKSLIQHVKDVKDIDASEALTCGPLSFEIHFYPREANFARNHGLGLQQLKDMLDHNGGVKIYRDNISVKPYGFEGKDGEDWLNLGERHAADPAGIARETWTVLRSQLIGSVYIGRDQNPTLQDSAGREGLIHNEGYYDLRALVLAGIRLLEVHRHTVYKKLNEGKPAKVSSKRLLDRYKKELNVLKMELATLKTEIPGGSEHAESAQKQLSIVIDETDSAEKSIEEILDKNRTMGGLATIGISAAVFGHETQLAIAHFKTLVATVRVRMKKPVENKAKIIDSLEKAASTASRISNWGSFALSKVRRDKRVKGNVDVQDLITRTLDDLEPAMKARTIDVSRSLEAITVRSFAMDLEAVLLNLLTNAYAACLGVSEPRMISVQLKSERRNSTDGFLIIVADSGPGIPEDLREVIWEPLFTTKTDGGGHETGFGLGLSIVQSIVDELQGFREVSNDAKLKGARFCIWLPK